MHHRLHRSARAWLAGVALNIQGIPVLRRLAVGQRLKQRRLPPGRAIPTNACRSLAGRSSHNDDYGMEVLKGSAASRCATQSDEEKDGFWPSGPHGNCLRGEHGFGQELCDRPWRRRRKACCCCKAPRNPGTRGRRNSACNRHGNCRRRSLTSRRRKGGRARSALRRRQAVWQLEIVRRRRRQCLRPVPYARWPLQAPND